MPEKRMHILKRINGKIMGGGMVCLIVAIVILVRALHAHPEGIEGSFVEGLVETLFVFAAASIIWSIPVAIIFGIPTDTDWYWDRSINWSSRRRS